MRSLYDLLRGEGADPWLDEKRLLPGQEWRPEIEAAVRHTDVVLVCISSASITKEGYVQKEIRIALDIADEKPEGTIFIVPVRLDSCQVPARLSRWQWVDLFDPSGFGRLLEALRARAQQSGLCFRRDLTPTLTQPDPPCDFWFYYQFPPEGTRHWRKVTDTEWHEKYPDGHTDTLSIVGRTTIDGINGTVVVKLPATADFWFELFIPDKGSRLMWLRQRLKVGGAYPPWGYVAEMYDIS
jgi:hypothetical protein